MLDKHYRGTFLYIVLYTDCYTLQVEVCATQASISANRYNSSICLSDFMPQLRSTMVASTQSSKGLEHSWVRENVCSTVASQAVHNSRVR